MNEKKIEESLRPSDQAGKDVTRRQLEELSTEEVKHVLGGVASLLPELTANYVFTNWDRNSDRNAKEDFAAIDSDDVLRKVSCLQITSWKYKDDVNRARHMGPMAQDFHVAFGLGSDDRTISTVDSAGVALAAIQALHRQMKELEVRIRNLEGQLAEVSFGDSAAWGADA